MSNNGFFNETIYKILIQQNLGDVIPFTYYGENNFQNSSDMTFSFRGNNSYLNFDNIKNPTIIPETRNTIYIQNNEDSHYLPTFYLDLITNSPTKEVSVSTGLNKNKHTPKYTFPIPKFTWSKNTYTTQVLTGSAWVGSGNTIYKIEYNSEKAIITYQMLLDSEIQNIYFDTVSNLAFITTHDHLYKYSIDHYLDSTSKYTLLPVKDKYIFNEDRETITLYNDSVFGVVPSENKINLRDDNLKLISNYQAFDSPKKIIKSIFHNFYVVSGTNILWKYDTTPTAIYEIKNYAISDFDVSKDGKVCILFNGINDSILRILDNNLFTILYEKKITNGNFKYCKVCDNLFYIIAELDGGTAEYVLGHYIYDIMHKNIFITTNNTVQDNAESSSDEPATSKIELTYPIGGEKIELGQTINIKWKSTESITDKVKIELYDTDLIQTITSNTNNSGSYSWIIPSTLELSETYTIKITLLTANSNPADSGVSANFTITDYVSYVEVSEYNKIVGIGYDDKNNYIVISTSDGFLGMFDLSEKKLYGLFDLGLDIVNCIGVRNEKIKTFSTITKVRIFVGTDIYLNNMWDSGDIETELSSIIYTGKELLSGETYYINLQAFSEEFGYSDVQTKKFIMP